MTFDWNGNGREDFGDHYIDYEIYNDIYNNPSSNNSGGGYKPAKRKKTYTEEELEENWVFIRIVFIILGLVVGFIGFSFNIIALLIGGYVNWLGLTVCPAILVLIIRYINKNGWPK